MTMKLNYSKTHPNYCSLEVPSYQGGQLKLAEPSLEHAESSLSWTADASVVQYMGGNFDQPSIEKERARINEIRNNSDEYNWMIELDGKTIGNVSINSIKETSSKMGAKAGNYTILIGDKNLWSKGIARCVTLAVLEWAFSKGGFEAMAARALNENVASIKMLGKLGFKYVGNSPYQGKIDGKSTEWQNFRISNLDGIRIDEMRNTKEIDFLRGKSSFNYAYDKATIDSLKKHFALKDSLYLIAKKGPEFVAFCSTDRDWWEENYFFIREILVDPNFQKLGIGKTLMSKCIDHARSKKAVGVVTETAFDNLPMQNLCARFGFEKWNNPEWDKGVTYKLIF